MRTTRWITCNAGFGLALALTLAACGGGGGGSSGSSGGGTPAAALRFEPATLAANFQAGKPLPLSVTATALRPEDFNQNVFVVAVDEKQVIHPNITLTALSAGTYSARITPSALLAVGRYTGTLSIRLCKDSACTAQFPGSPVPLPYDFNVQEVVAPLGFSSLSPAGLTAYSGDAKPQSLTLRLSGDKLRWSLTSDVPWLVVGSTASSGTGPQDVTVTTKPDALATGSHKGRITATTQDGQSASIEFNLQVLERQFVLVGNMPSFTLINGSVAQPQTLNFALNNQQAVAWSASTTADWMQLSPLSGVTPGSITLQPDASRGPLVPGRHNADIKLSSAGIATKTVTTQLNLMSPTLSTNATSLVFGGPKGRDFTPQPLSIGLSTNVDWPWTMGRTPAWFLPGATSGKAGAATAAQTVAVDATKAPLGTTTEAVALNAVVNGEKVSTSLSITINADQRRLLPSAWGVGLASTPTGQVLTRTLQVRDNFGGALAWTAASSAGWLSVTASGRTDHLTPLQLTADPTGLPVGQLSLADVTLATSQAGVAPAVVRVGLWKDASGAVALRKLPLDRDVLVADTIRPYVYTHAGGSDVEVYHAYTGQKLATWANVGAALGAMAVSPDGSLLYVADTANRNVRRVNLDTGLALAAWELRTETGPNDTVVVTRINGVELLVISAGHVYAAGRYLGQVNSGATLAATPDGRLLAWQNTGVSPASAGIVSLDYSEVNGGMLMPSGAKGAPWFYNSSSNGQDIAVAPDGARVYTATGAPYRCSVLAGTDMSVIGSLPGGEAYPNNVEVTSDGRVLCGISGAYAASDFWVHTAAGALIKGHRVASNGRQLKTRQMVVTPDGLIVAVLTNDPVLGFVVIGP